LDAPEFDAVRERLAYLRDHPDLSRLEPEVLEVAAHGYSLSRKDMNVVPLNQKPAAE